MSAAPERREPIDIDEFERRLMGSESVRRAEDPLVELTRLLNQQQAGDPVAHLFAENRGPAPAPSAAPFQSTPTPFPAAPFPPAPTPFPPPPPVAAPPVDGAAPPVEPFADFPDLRPLLRGGMDETFVAPQAPTLPDRPDFPSHVAAPVPFPEPPVPSAQYEDWAEAPELAPEAVAPDQRPPRSRKPLYVAGAVIAAGFVAIGATLAFRGGAHQAGGVATIAASTAPTKIQPKETENADKTARESTMLERTAAPPVKKVVTREEQPMDVSTAARTPRVIPLDDGTSAAGSASPSGSTSAAAIAPPPPPQREPAAARSAFPEPKRVKTVSVRADGSIIGADAAAAPTAPKPPERATPAPARNATPKSAARADATTTAVAPKPVAKPKAEAKPAPKPERVAAAPPPEEQAAAAAEPADEEDTAKPVASGSYALQIASAGSEAEARQTASRLAGKLSGALGGRRPSVIKASDTLYRVRVTGLSKESAVAMCGKVKAAGGACFVAR